MDDSHLARFGAKRPRLQENVNVLTSFGSTVQSNSDADGALWKSEYEKKAQEKLALEIKHIENQSKYEKLENKFDDCEKKNEELQKKNEELQAKLEVLEEANQSLQLLCDNQNSRISQLPNEIEVSHLNETIAKMESDGKRDLRKVADLEMARETYKAKIAEVKKKREDDRQAFEKEKKDLRERVEQRDKVLKENHQNEINAKDKDRDQVIVEMKKQREVDKAKLAEMEKKLESYRKYYEMEKKMLLSKIAVMERSIVSPPSNVHSNTAITSIAHSKTVSSSPNQSVISKSTNANDGQLVIKKLFHVQGGTEWEAYFTWNEQEEPTKLCLKESNLLINGEKILKKLVINGGLSQSNVNPFNGFTHNYGSSYQKFISRLLSQHVRSCNLTDLILNNQQMSWMEYEKLVSAGKTKRLYFSNVCIKKEDGTLVSFEEIMEKLPNVKRVGCAFHPICSIKLTKETFTKLLELPVFKNLKMFRLYGITASDPFNVDSFIDLMKKYPSCHFTVSFRFNKRRSLTEKTPFDPVVKKLREAFPSDDKLVIET